MQPRLAGPLAAVALAYAVTLAVLPPGGLWTVDNGNKYLQMEALLASGFRDFALPWPGRGLDPQLEFDPLPGAFSLVRDGRLYSVFSPLFPALSALPFRAFGDVGLCLLPLLATLAGLAGVGRIAALAALPPRAGALAVVLAGLATPLWFYAAVFWEHALAAGLCVGAVALALDFLEGGALRRLGLAGLLLALAAGFRDALLLFAPVLGALVLVAAPRGRARACAAFAAGLAAGLVPLSLFQWLALGDPLGFHLTHGFEARGGEAHGLGFHLATRPAALYNLLLAAAEERGLSLALSAPLLALLLARPRLGAQAHRCVALAAAGWALVATAVSLAGQASAPRPIAHLLASNGFFAAAPLLAVGFVRGRPDGSQPAADRVVSRLLGLALGYALLYTALTPLRNTTGIHWGNRYLLELYPLLAVPAAAGLLGLWRSGRLSRLLVMLLLSGAVALQLVSLDLLRRKLAFGERLEQAVRERPEALVVTDQWWVPQTLARVYFEKPIYYVATRDKARTLFERLSARGVDAYAFVTKDGERAAAPGARVVDDGGLGYFTLRVERRTLAPARPGGLLAP